MLSGANKYQLQAKLKKFEGKFAVLEILGQQTIKWPIKQLPDDIQEGADLNLIISTPQSIKEDRDRVIKETINQILNP